MTAAHADPYSYEQVFLENYRREYGFELVGRAILVDDVRVRAVGRSPSSLSLQQQVNDVSPEVITEASDNVECTGNVEDDARMSLVPPIGAPRSFVSPRTELIRAGSASGGQLTDTSVTDVKPVEIVKVYFEGGRLDTPVYHLQDVPGGTILDGPVIIMQNVATVVVEPGTTIFHSVLIRSLTD
jgi:N-methylhydantoinase A/oxoprolinase/acetone carboxylase beta subunit